MDHPDRRAPLFWTLSLAMSLLAGCLFVVSQQLGQLLVGASLVSRLRTLAWNDQLSYMGISANVRDGLIASVEPFTRTGVSHYPMGYYAAVGFVARILDINTVSSWNLIGLGIQTAAAVALSLAVSVLSRKWWLGILAPLPFIAGTYSYLGGRSWYTALDHHAVLWGPFGALFSKNGEGAGLSVTVLAMAICAYVWRVRTHPAVRWALSSLVGAMVGSLAFFQTYSFLGAVYAFAFIVAGVLVVTSPHRWWWTLATASLLLVVLTVGSSWAQHFGQLATLMLGLLPSLPGLVLATLRSRGMFVLPTGAAIATAAPQVVSTWLGVAEGDPFLVYRVASNTALGVLYPVTALASLPVLVPLLAAGVLGIVRRDLTVVGISLGMTVCFAYLSANDLWGANAEPYRFWINGFLLSGAVALLCWAMLVSWSAPSVSGRPLTRGRDVAAVLAGVSAVALITSLPDWVNYSRDQSTQATWSPSTSRDQAITSVGNVAAQEPERIVLTSGCVDPRTLKVTTGAAVAYYNLGLAWPANKDAIDTVGAVRGSEALDFAELAEAQVGWLVTDSNCDPGWGERYNSRLTSISHRDYVLTAGDISAAAAPSVPPTGTLTGTITLWRVN